MNVTSNVGPNSERLMLQLQTIEITCDANFYETDPENRVHSIVRGCSHETGATFVSARVHSSSLSWLCICLHDTTTKCHIGTSHTGVSSHRLLCRSENSTPVRNFPTVSCKRETTTRFGVKSVPCAGRLERVAHA